MYDVQPRLILEVTERIEAHAHELSKRMLDAYRLEIAAYNEAADELFLANVQEGSMAVLLSGLRALKEDRLLSADELAVLKKAIGHRRAETGFPLDSVLQAIHVGARIVLSAMFDETQDFDPDKIEIMKPAFLAVLDTARQVSAAVTDGYVQEQQRRTERRERVEAHFFQDLLTGNFDEETILYRAKKVGYDLAQPYATLVIATGAAEEEGRSPASSTAEIVLRVGRARGAIGYIARGHVVLLTRYVNAQTLERFAAEIFEMVQERVGTAVVVSVGLPGTQMREVHQSYLDALDTLNAACQLRKSGIVRREEMIPYRIVAANERLREHLSLVVRPLASYDTKNGLQLIETLEAFFAANQSTRVAAERLHVHRHTVDYRLQKIEALCGRDLHNPVDRLLLELGLLALRSSPTE